jgi:hypothetical protein
MPQGAGAKSPSAILNEWNDEGLLVVLTGVATESTLGDLLEELEAKADLAEIQPVCEVARGLTQIDGTKSESGDNTLVDAPGSEKHIVVCAFAMQNESATATTMRLLDGSGGQGWRCLGQNQGDGLAINFVSGREWRLSENTALIFNLSGANQCGYSISYFVEDV